MKPLNIKRITNEYCLAAYCPKCETHFRVEALTPWTDDYGSDWYEPVEQRVRYCYWCGEKLDAHKTKEC